LLINLLSLSENSTEELNNSYLEYKSLMDELIKKLELKLKVDVGDLLVFELFKGFKTTIVDVTNVSFYKDAGVNISSNWSRVVNLKSTNFFLNTCLQTPKHYSSFTNDDFRNKLEITEDVYLKSEKNRNLLLAEIFKSGVNFEKPVQFMVMTYMLEILLKEKTNVNTNYGDAEGEHKGTV